MGIARLYTKTFSSARELCNFVDDYDISVIVQTVVRDNLYVLFYRN